MASMPTRAAASPGRSDNSTVAGLEGGGGLGLKPAFSGARERVSRPHAPGSRPFRGGLFSLVDDSRTGYTVADECSRDYESGSPLHEYCVRNGLLKTSKREIECAGYRGEGFTTCLREGHGWERRRECEPFEKTNRFELCIREGARAARSDTYCVPIPGISTASDCMAGYGWQRRPPLKREP